MSVAITRGDFAAAAQPILGKWFDSASKDYDSDHKKIFKSRDVKTAYIEDQLKSGIGLMQAIPEGEDTPYQKMNQGYYTRYTPMDYRTGLAVTQNMLDDGLQVNMLIEQAKELGKSAAHTKDESVMQVMNKAFSATQLGGDGVSLLNANHPTKGGGFSNLLASAADLSEAALEQCDQELGDIRDEVGLRMSLKPMKLVIPRASKFNAHRIIKSSLRSGTANNDTNAINDMNLFPGGIVVADRLTDSNAFFILTDEDSNGLQVINRKEPTLSADKEFSNDNSLFKIHGRWTAGFTNPRHVFGTPGA